ncbi:hypothetical protein MLAC_22860 [Mycobacterium lacus]|uniref:Uncharacterized protein n=1 Tax=Mycobacterium lacus TaxID=169765 RepID=A0A7I7NK24_9MYCO|nr:hypothetical protein MLAC_22860 [Mycobacterium lacus]
MHHELAQVVGASVQCGANGAHVRATEVLGHDFHAPEVEEADLVVGAKAIVARMGIGVERIRVAGGTCRNRRTTSAQTFLSC